MTNIQTILEAKRSMERCVEKNIDFISLLKQMDKYLYKHCKHVIVKDLIDIDPDRSKTIYYCEKCEFASLWVAITMIERHCHDSTS